MMEIDKNKFNEIVNNILFAYSRFIGQNETETIKNLTQFSKFINEKTKQNEESLQQRQDDETQQESI